MATLPTNADFAKAILGSKDSGSARMKPGLYLLRIIRSGIRQSTREGDFRSFFRYEMEVVKTVEDGSRYTIAPNPVVPPLNVGEECSSVVEVPGREGFGYREVKAHVKTLTGLSDDQLGSPAKQADGQTALLIPQADGTSREGQTIEALVSYELSLLSPIVFLGRAQNIVDKKTKTFRVDSKGNPFVKLDVIRLATDEELKALPAPKVAAPAK